MSADAAVNKAAGARILVGALLFALGELRRADPDAAEVERARAVRALGGGAGRPDAAGTEVLDVL